MFKILSLIALLLAPSARADAPVIWSGTTAKWLPSGLNSAGMCKLSSAGVMTSGQASLTTNVSGVLPYANGGSNASTSWTAGSVIFGGTSAFAQDNAHLFWDDTNDRLGVNTATPSSTFEVMNSLDDAFTGSPVFKGSTGADAATWAHYINSAGKYSIVNKGLTNPTIQFTSPGRTIIGNGASGHPDATLLIKNQAGETAMPTLVLMKMASQTSDPFSYMDVDEVSLFAKIDVAGKGFFSNLRDTALSTGIAHVDSSGDITSSAVVLSASDVSGNLGVSHLNSGTSASSSTFWRGDGAWATPIDTGITQLTGDVTAGAGSGSQAATVAKIQSTVVSGTTGSGNVVFATFPTMTNPVVGTQSFGDNTTKAASTAFVQTALNQLNPAAAVIAASTVNIPGTYTNAVGGVCIGDTFQVTSTAAFAPDGVTLTVGQRFLMKNQSSGFQNGVWTLTTAANVGVLGALLTRALDWDTSSDINAGNLIPVISGTANATTVWFQSATVTTCSSDSQVYTQFSGSSGGGCVPPVLTKTTNYTISSGDFTCANKVLLVEANCSSECAITFPAASNSGYEVDLINIGTATVTGTLPGSDTFGSTADQTWIMPPGGSPQVSNIFKANGGTRWNGF